MQSTHRQLTTSSQSQTDKMVGQRFSQTLLLKFLGDIAVLYVIMTVLSLPLWVLSAIEFRNILLTKSHVQPIDVFMLGTIGYLNRQHKQLPNNQIKSGNHIRSLSEVGIGDTNEDINKRDANKNLGFCLYYDIGLQILLCVGLSVIEYKCFRSKQKHKGNHIQDYSLQICNVPVAHPYILLPKLQHHLITHLNTNFELIGAELHLFDAVSACGQQAYMHCLLTSELDTRMAQLVEYANIGQASQTECKRRIQQLEDLIRKCQADQAQTDMVWVTFYTRQARYLALRFLQSSQAKFMNRKLKVNKAPHPLEIQWQNIHLPFIHTLLSKGISLFVCMGLLLLFDLLILYIHKSAYPLLASLAILILEIILKEIIIVVSSYEKHSHKSCLYLSIFSKLTKYLYINTTLILFISCYDFGNNPLVRTFSTGTYDSFDDDWFRGVGMSILLSFCMQIFYVNFRPAIEVIKATLRASILHHWKYPTSTSPNDNNRSMDNQRLKSQLQICYAHIVSLVMFTNTYSLTHPVLYPLSCAFGLAAYYSHRRYIAQYTQAAPYNSDYLNSASIQYLYASVIAHWIMVAIGYSFLPALLCAAVGTALLLFKNTLIVMLSEMGRKKFGPFCFSKFQRSHASTTPLSSLLTTQQLHAHIGKYRHKIEMYTYLYNAKFETEDFINRGCLQRAIKGLQQKITTLEHYRTQLENPPHETLQNDPNPTINKKESQQIKGVISYHLTEDMLRDC